MIDPNLDHDEKTEPGGGWPAGSALKEAGARFEILLRWGSTQSGISVDRVEWHCVAETRMKWRGTFDEAVEIVRAKYGPRRGTEALIVVRVDE